MFLVNHSFVMCICVCVVVFLFGISVIEPRNELHGKAQVCRFFLGAACKGQAGLACTATYIRIQRKI